MILSNFFIGLIFMKIKFSLNLFKRNITNES